MKYNSYYIGDGKYLTIPCDGVRVIAACTVIRVDRRAVLKKALDGFNPYTSPGFQRVALAVGMATVRPRHY